MQTTKKIINIVQVIASLCLGISYLLPFYGSHGILGKVHYADNAWGLFFWPIPVIGLIYLLAEGMLKAAFCFLSAIGGILDIFLITFLATFKTTPLIGFHTAKTSLGILVISWLILSVSTLRASKIQKAETSFVQIDIDSLGK